MQRLANHILPALFLGKRPVGLEDEGDGLSQVGARFLQGGSLRIGARTFLFPFTDALEQLLEAQKAEHDCLKAKDVICPWVFNRSNRKVKGKRITTFVKAFTAACTKADCPGRIPHDLRRTAIRNLVRAGVPERVAMQMTGHKTRSVFERYNIVSECDLLEAARKLNAIQPASVPPDGGSHASDGDGHNLGI